MSGKKFVNVLTVTAVPLALALFSAKANADWCPFTWWDTSCDYSDDWGNPPPYDNGYPVGNGGGGGGGGASGTGGNTFPGYSGPQQISTYIQQNRRYCRAATQSCSNWASTAGGSSQGAYSICDALAPTGSFGNAQCSDVISSIYLGLGTYTWVCAEAAC